MKLSLRDKDVQIIIAKYSSVRAAAHAHQLLGLVRVWELIILHKRGVFLML